VLDLEGAEAPMHVFRWVSDAAGPAAHRQRTDLALHIRRSVERRRNGWVADVQLAAALGVWEDAVVAARGRGLITPRPDAIPLERYLHAIKRARGPRREEAVPEPVPVPIPVPEGEPVPDESSRAQTLRTLTAALDGAIAGNDMVAAEIAHGAIGTLGRFNLVG
jgi:hypothetical protein